MKNNAFGLQEYPPVLTVRQAADILQVSTKTICELCRIGALAEFLSDEVTA